MKSQPPRISARRRHNIDIGISGNRGGKRDLRTVGRKIRIYLDTGCRSKSPRRSATARNRPKVTRIFESNQVAADRRMAKHPRALRRHTDRDQETQYYSKD